MLRYIKRIILEALGDDRLMKIKYFISWRYCKNFRKIKKDKKIFYLLTPEHGNMGDQAIAVATIKFIKENFKEYKLIEFTRDEIYLYGKAIKKAINNDDFVILHGGGNMGNLYIKEENARRLALKIFKDNKIISMTQTISFTEDNIGKKEIEKSRKVYNKCKKLILIASKEA